MSLNNVNGFCIIDNEENQVSKYIQKAVKFENTMPSLYNFLQNQYEIERFEENENLKISLVIFKNKADADNILQEGFIDAFGFKILATSPRIDMISSNSSDTQIDQNSGDDDIEILSNMQEEISFNSHIFPSGLENNDNINERILYIEGCKESHVITILNFLKNPRFGGAIEHYSFDNNLHLLKILFKKINDAIKALNYGEIKINKKKSFKIFKHVTDHNRTIYIHNVEEKDIVVALIEAEVGEIDLSKAHYDSNTKIYKMVLNNLEDTEKLLNISQLKLDDDYFCDITRLLCKVDEFTTKNKESLNNINECKSLKEPYILYISGIKSEKFVKNILLFVRNVSFGIESHEFLEKEKILKIFYNDQNNAKNLLELGELEFGKDCVYTFSDNIKEDITLNSYSEINYFPDNHNISERTIYINKISEEKYFHTIKPLIESTEIGRKIYSYKFDKIKESVEIIFFKEEDALRIIWIEDHNHLLEKEEFCNNDEYTKIINENDYLKFTDIPHKISPVVFFKYLLFRYKTVKHWFFDSKAHSAYVYLENLNETKIILSKKIFCVANEMIPYQVISSKFNYESNSNLIKFSDIPKTLDKKLFLAMIENKRYNGGDILSYQFINDSESCLVIYVKKKIANGLLNKGEIIYKGNKMIISEYKIGLKLYISNIFDKVLFDKFNALLENYGPIDVIDYRLELKTACIIYENLVEAHNLLSEKFLLIENNIVIISKTEDIQCKKQHIHDSNLNIVKLKLSNIPEIVDQQDLKDHLVKIMKCKKVLSLDYNQGNNEAEVIIEQPQIVLNYNRPNEFQYNDKILKIYIMEPLDTEFSENVFENIKEDDIPFKITTKKQYETTFDAFFAKNNHNFLHLYCNNSSYDGGPLTLFNCEHSNGFCLLVFENKNDAEKILNKDPFLKYTSHKLIPSVYPNGSMGSTYSIGQRNSCCAQSPSS